MRTKKTEYKHVLLWPDGTPTVSGTRLKVKLIGAAYRDGASAEEIQQDYPEYSLAEIHSAIAYYLDHREQMDREWEDSRRRAEEAWVEIQRRQGRSPTREELQERLKLLGRAR
jgi:uncharacterized protein (DUF433 family)